MQTPQTFKSIIDTIEQIVKLNDDPPHSYTKWRVEILRDRQTKPSFSYHVWNIGNYTQCNELSLLIESKGAEFINLPNLPTQKDLQKYIYLAFYSKENG